LGGANWYAYVNNDPVNFVDPVGLEGTEAQNAGDGSAESPIDQLGEYGDPRGRRGYYGTNARYKTNTTTYDPSGGGRFIAESLRPEHGALNALATGSGLAGTVQLTTYREYGASQPSNYVMQQVQESTDGFEVQPGTGKPLYSLQTVNEESAEEILRDNPELAEMALEQSQPSLGQRILEGIIEVLVPKE
jgi:hypothetical protein